MNPSAISRLVDYLILKSFDSSQRFQITEHSSPLADSSQPLVWGAKLLGRYDVKNVVFNFALFGYQYELLDNSDTLDNFGYGARKPGNRSIVGYNEVKIAVFFKPAKKLERK